jgi:hypothetical protein
MKKPIFYQREKAKNIDSYKMLYEIDGSVIVIFTSKIEYDEGRYVAGCWIKDKDFIYDFGIMESPVLKAFVVAMNQYKMRNEDLIGSRWKIKCISSNDYNWQVEYLGSIN